MKHEPYDLQAMKTENFERGIDVPTQDFANALAENALKLMQPVFLVCKTVGGVREYVRTNFKDFEARLAALKKMPMSVERYCSVCDELGDLFARLDVCSLFACGLPDAYELLSQSPNPNGSCIVDADSKNRCMSHLMGAFQKLDALCESFGCDAVEIFGKISNGKEALSVFKARGDGTYVFDGKMLRILSELCRFHQEQLVLIPDDFDLSGITKDVLFHGVSHAQRVAPINIESFQYSMEASEMLATRKALLVHRDEFRKDWKELREGEAAILTYLPYVTDAAEKASYEKTLTWIREKRKAMASYAESARLSVEHILSEREIVVRPNTSTTPAPQDSALPIPYAAETKSVATRAADEGMVAGEYVPGMVLDGYKIIRALGHGAMGAVYEVEDVNLGGPHLAMKFFSPCNSAQADRLKKRFDREARLLHKISKDASHASVRLPRVSKYDPNPQGMPPYYVMDLIIGPNGSPCNLGEVPRKAQEYYDLDWIGVWFGDACTALDALHRNGCLHRDLKPDNIVLDFDGHAVITDFGTAKSIQGDVADDVSDALTLVGRFEREQVGTRKYWAPELRDGDEASVASDLYALGATFWNVLFHDDFRQSDYPPSGERFEDLEDGDRWLRVLSRMLAPKPADRPNTAAECLQLFKKDGEVQ